MSSVALKLSIWFQGLLGMDFVNPTVWPNLRIKAGRFQFGLGIPRDAESRNAESGVLEMLLKELFAECWRWKKCEVSSGPSIRPCGAGPRLELGGWEWNKCTRGILGKVVRIINKMGRQGGKTKSSRRALWAWETIVLWGQELCLVCPQIPGTKSQA